MWPKPHKIVDLVTFTEEVPNVKLIFCAVAVFKCNILLRFSLGT